MAAARAQARGTSEVFVIGGLRIFAGALPVAHRIYLTQVHGSPEGDVRWSPQLGGEWAVKSQKNSLPVPRMNSQ